MGQFRRTALIALIALVPACMSAPPAPAASKEVKVKLLNGSQPGHFSVENPGSAPVDLLRKVLVERLDGKVWVETASIVNLVAACTEKETTPRRIAPGATLHVAPWNGWGCNGQCPRACRSNYYIGPGEFRFVVFTSDRKQRFEGPAFALGPEKAQP